MHHNLSWIKSYLCTTMTGYEGLALLSVYNDTSYIPTTAELRAEFLKKKRRLMESTLL